jgi:hypothetical protein
LKSLIATAALLVCAAVSQTGFETGPDTFIFTQGNANIGGNTSVASPYETLVVTGNTTTGIMDLSLTVAGGNNARFAQLGFDFQNFSWSDVASVTITNTGTVGSVSHWGVLGSGQLDGFGRFDQVIGATSSGGGNRLNGVDIQIQFKNGFFGDATASNFEVQNAGGGNGPAFYFASDYFPPSGITGYVGDSQPAISTPAPSGLVLASIGLGCFGFFAWARRRRIRLA